MADTDADFHSSSVLKIFLFHGRRGEDYGLLWTRLRTAFRVKCVWNFVKYVSNTLASSRTDRTITSQDVSVSRCNSKFERDSGMNVSALGDVLLREFMEAADQPDNMLQLLDGRHGPNCTVSRIYVHTELFRISYTRNNCSSYKDQWSSWFSQLERMAKGAAIPESHKTPMLFVGNVITWLCREVETEVAKASIDPYSFLESTVAA